MSETIKKLNAASAWARHSRSSEPGSPQSLDDDSTPSRHAEIIKRKFILKSIYLEHYRYFRQELSGFLPAGQVVELGSGGGFIKEVIPTVLTSDVVGGAPVDRIFSALHMPFEDASVDAFVMIDVFHHVPNAGRFLQEMRRCLKPGGRIIMVEPANTLWSGLIWRFFHHEPYEPQGGWTFQSDGPMSSANSALPWIVFQRDAEKFKTLFPEFRLHPVRPHSPFRYLVSGGVSRRQLLPDFCYPAVKGIEWLLTPLNRLIGMFITVQIVKDTP